MTAVSEGVDTSAADQAWRDMNVKCDHLDLCEETATWGMRPPCGCIRPRCETHRHEITVTNPAPTLRCVRCGATGMPKWQITWWPL